MPSRYEYVAWFRNPTFPPNDEDHEWPAVFLIDAVSPQAARSWGDSLSRRYAERTGQEFLFSEVAGAGDNPAHLLPVVRDGERVEDTHIGW